MYNNEDVMGKLEEVSKDVLEDINILSNQVHRLRKKIYDENNLEPELYIVYVEDRTLDTYRLVDFVKSFNESLFYGKNLYLFLDKDEALDYLKAIRFERGV